METIAALFTFWREQAGKLGEQTLQHPVCRMPFISIHHDAIL